MGLNLQTLHATTYFHLKTKQIKPKTWSKMTDRVKTLCGYFHHSSVKALSVFHAIHLEGNLKIFLIFILANECLHSFYNHKEILQEVHCRAIMKLIGG